MPNRRMMTDKTQTLAADFPEATEAAWLAAVSGVLKGKDAATLNRRTAEGLTIKPLYRESDFPAALDPRGVPGAAPYLRGAHVAPDAYLPWDIRQRFDHPLPPSANPEILRDLERGVSSVELVIDPAGENGIQLQSLADYNTTLNGVRADIAAVALAPCDDGVASAALLAMWAEGHQAAAAKLDFNIDVLGALARYGAIAHGLVGTFEQAGALINALGPRLPQANFLRIDASLVHEAGGSDAEELAFLIASAVDALRQLAPHTDTAALAPRMLFALALDANYGVGIAKLRAARRLWAGVQDALGLKPSPMKLQAITSARMLTKYDPWTNILRGTAAAFAGATGGADFLTVRAFNEPLGRAEELGRRIARNTQIIAMEESGLGRIADPMGGAWFAESHGEALAQAAWEKFQEIEREGGLAQSLMAEKFQARVRATAEARAKDIARRKIPITGVSEFPLLDEIAPPVAEPSRKRPVQPISRAGLEHFGAARPASSPTSAVALAPIRLSAPFEALRDKAASAKSQPAIFLATLGPLAEFSARADFARNLFAAGGLRAAEAVVPPKTPGEAAAAFRASGARIACVCGADTRYTDEAAPLAEALKKAGAAHVFLAGKHEGPSIDTNIFAGGDALHALALAHAALGL